jgi:hypothetical protein
MDATTDPNALYTELSTFNDATSGEWALNQVTAIPSFQSYYALGQHTLNQYNFATNGTIQKTFSSAIDISAFSEIALWIFSYKYYGRFITLGLGANAPNEYTHDVLVKAKNQWVQDTWDISAIPSATLQTIKYITLTVAQNPISNVPFVVCFDEMVARKTTMLESVVRALTYLLDGKVTDTKSNQVMRARVRTPEFYQREEPGYLIHLDPPDFDNRVIGRYDGTITKKEFITVGQNQSWKLAPSRRAYLCRVQIDVYTKYGVANFGLIEYLLEAIPPRGALQVAGDLIDFILLSSASLDEGDAEQRMQRKTYEYELWTWDNPAKYTAGVSLDANLTIGYLPPAVGAQIEMRPDVYVIESK